MRSLAAAMAAGQTVIFYFTAAGDSLYLARELEDHPVSIAQAIHDPGQVFTDRQIGIVCGLVAHRLPVPVAEFLERFRFETEYFYFILIGTQQWNAALQQQAEALGVTPVYWRTCANRYR